MKFISATEYKNNLGKYFDLSLQNEEIIICRYNRPILKIIPISRQDSAKYIESEDVKRAIKG